jgi:hypothetical protein
VRARALARGAKAEVVEHRPRHRHESAWREAVESEHTTVERQHKKQTSEDELLQSTAS